MNSISQNDLTRRRFMTTAAGSLLGVGLLPGLGGRAFGPDPATTPGQPLR